ncbi:HD domain-containing protein, partial [Myxococcota bacterium]|nr:HD domain-containing protein [Myxococcota bacterium]
AYPDSGYQEIIQELQEDQAALCGIDRFCQSLDSLKEKGYLEEIRRLKYLRRWNTRNRAIETSVMGHTFVVAALALVAARLEVERGDEVLPEGFVLKVMLRALFHDLPEVYTGDVITPVKVRIVKSTGMSWGDIETKVLAPFYKASSPEVIADVKRWSLLDELGPDKENDPVGALVNDCDKMALLVECLIEERMGRESVEMDRAFQRNARGLLRSKWTSVQDLVVDLLFAPRR